MTWDLMCMVFGGIACLIVAGDHTYTSPTVHAIYAVPADRAYEPRHAIAIGDAIEDVLGWYREEAGVAFAVANTSPQVCYLAHKANRYAGEGGWYGVVDDVQHCAPVAWLTQWETWVIYADVDPPDCEDEQAYELGRGGAGIVIVSSGDLHGISIADSDTYAPCDLPARNRDGWVGGLAHELGHAFGLPHPIGCDTGEDCDDDKSGNSLMWTGYFYDYPDTYLLDSDKAYLREFFMNPILRCQVAGYEEWCKNNWRR